MGIIIIILVIVGLVFLGFVLNYLLKNSDGDIPDNSTDPSITTPYGFIPIDAIKNNLLVLRGHWQYRIALKIRPINYYLYSTEEQDAFERRLTLSYNQITRPITFFHLSRPVPVRQNIEYLRSASTLVTAQRPEMEGYAEEYLRNLNSLTRSETGEEIVTLYQENYVIINFDDLMEDASLSIEERDAKANKEALHIFDTYYGIFNKAGLEAQLVTNAGWVELFTSIFHSDQAELASQILKIENATSVSDISRLIVATPPALTDNPYDQMDTILDAAATSISETVLKDNRTEQATKDDALDVIDYIQKLQLLTRENYNNFKQDAH